MRNWLVFLFILLISSPLSAFQGANNGVGDTKKDEYLTILEEAQKNKKVKVANLASSDRANDPAALRPIREADVMFKVRLWTKLNFNEKINGSFKSDESKLIEVIYEGVEEYFSNAEGNGIAPYSAEGEKLYPRTNFNVDEPLKTKADFEKAITNNLREVKDPSQAEIDARVSELRLKPEYQDPNLDLNGIADDQLKTERQQAVYFEKDADFREIVMEEDLVFDKNHSVPMWDIISITISSPAVDGLSAPLFKVKYSDVKNYIDKVYKETNGDNAFWFNPRNPGSRNLSFSDALDKRMFNSYIVSVENVDNADILNGFAAQDNYNALVFAEKIRLQLLERMHNLWEY